jgi:hypothetical protein
MTALAMENAAVWILQKLNLTKGLLYRMQDG